MPRGAEARAVRQGLVHARSQIAVVEMGIGSRAATLAIEDYLRSAAASPRRILVTGLAGVLSPGLTVGDALVYSSIARANAPAIRLDPDFARYLARAVPRSVDGIAGIESSTIVTRTADKIALAAESGAAAVDMESYAIAGALAERNIAAGILRVGSDALDDDLPRIDRALDGSGGIDSFSMFLAMVREPALGISLARNGMRALGALRRTIRALAFYGAATPAS